jgi:outer membrane murein-binding lipoprotein Lpp
MIKFLVDSAKGISTIKITKEVSQMTETTETAVDAVVENVEITPEAQPAEVETPAVADETPADTVVEKSDDGGAVPSAPVVEEESVVPEVEAELAVAKSDESIVDAVAEIKNSLTNAFGDLAATIKSLNEQVEALSKSVDTVSTEVTQVKGQFNEFGKRVDAVEQDTAFRKSGDLGEIVQFEPVKVQKSLWGGRFLKNSDLFN